MSHARATPNPENASREDLEAAVKAATSKLSGVRLPAIKALIIGVELEQLMGMLDAAERTTRVWLLPALELDHRLNAREQRALQDETRRTIPWVGILPRGALLLRTYGISSDAFSLRGESLRQMSEKIHLVGPKRLLLPVRQTVLAAAVYLALAVVAALPGVGWVFRRPLLWFEGPEIYYRIWWFRLVLTGERESIWHLSNVLPPDGVPLMLTSNGLGKEWLFAVLGWWLDPTVAGNLLMVTTPATVALAGFLVLRRLLHGAFLPALLGGWLCGLSGFGVVQQVHPWLASAEGLVIFLGALVLMRHRVTPLRVAVAGGGAALAAWFSIQNIVYLLTISSVYTAERAWRRDWQGIAAVVAAGGIAVLACLPLLWQTWRAYGGDFSAMRGETPLEAIFLWRVNLAQMVLPWERGWPLGGLSAWVAERTAHNPAPGGYLGWVVIPLALLGAWTRHRGTGFLAAMAVVGLLLSFGPVISLHQEPDTPALLFGPTWIPGPFYLLKDWPVLGSLRTPARFITIANLAMGLLAGYGMLRVMRWRKLRGGGSWKRPAVLAALLLLHTADRAVWPFEPVPRLHSSFHHGIAQEPGDFAVLDIPYGRGMKTYMYLSTYHEKTAIWGYGGRMQMDQLRQLEEDFRFPLVAAGGPETWPTDYERFAESLVRYNVRYILLHEHHLHYNEGIQELRGMLIDIIEDPATWENQTHIEPPVFAYSDRTIRAYRVLPKNHE